MGRYDRRLRRARRHYRRAVRWAFARVTFYREQLAAAGTVLAEPPPTPVAEIPDPPHTLCPFSRPWSAEREPSLWTPTLHPLARALRAAGCRGRSPVLEIRDSLLDRGRLPRTAGRTIWPAAYRVLLSSTAAVPSPEHRAALNREAMAVVDAGGAGWLVGAPEELAALPEGGDPRLRPVHRLPVAAVADGAHSANGDAPLLLHEPVLGYLGARVPGCGEVHLDDRVYARERDGVVTFSLPRSRRPVLLEMVPPGADRVSVGACPRHGTPSLRRRHGADEPSDRAARERPRTATAAA